MKRLTKYLTFLGFMTVLTGTVFSAIQINEIRTDEPGGTDSNEFVELKGTPGESLDGYWYLSIGDHTSFDNPNGENNPNKGGGVVEFAVDLDGEVIGDDGFFLITTFGFQFDVVFGLDIAEVDMPITEINFENSDNLTHVLVKGYTGTEVTNFADQYDDLAVDIDDDDDGVPNAVLPWTDTIDAIGLLGTANDDDPEEFGYGEALGFEDIGPRGSFTPGAVFRGSNDNQWNIGNFVLVNEAGDGLFLGDAFNGPALDTPSRENPPTLTNPRLFTINPTSARDGQVVKLRGDNLSDATLVDVGGEEIPFTVIDDATLEIVALDSMLGGIVTITTPNGVASLSTPLDIVVFEKQVLFFEDFEESAGDFIIVSLAGDWAWRRRDFGGNFFLEMSGFSDPVGASDDWLMTPEIDLTGTVEPTVSFDTTRNYDGPVLEVFISTNFDGLNPTTATWTPITATLSEGGWETVNSGEIDLSAYIGETVHIGWHYTSLGSESADGSTYQVDNVLFADNVLQVADFLKENFETDLGNFSVVSLASNIDWSHGTFNNEGFATMSGFGADTASDDWLISPPVDLSTVIFPIFSFVSARNFDGPVMEVLISSDYDGVDPSTANWEILDVSLSEGGYNKVTSENVGLIPYVGETVHVAFRYTSTGGGSGESATYEIHDANLTDGAEATYGPAWIDELQLGSFYYYGLAWAYHPTMGLNFLGNYPWIYNEYFGHVYVVGDDLSSGLWLYINGQWAWTNESLGGYFIYTDGSYDSFLNPKS